MLQEHPGLQLTCVDPWRASVPGTAWAETKGSDWIAGSDQDVLEQARVKAYCRLEPFMPRGNIMRMTSREACNWFSQVLDFVFVDGDHSLKGTRDAIEDWWGRIKPGGFMALHDYKNPPKEFPGVYHAVESRSDWDFCTKLYPCGVLVVRKGKL